jgi:hypothetical protein
MVKVSAKEGAVAKQISTILKNLTALYQDNRKDAVKEFQNQQDSIHCRLKDLSVNLFQSHSFEKRALEHTVLHRATY